MTRLVIVLRHEENSPYMTEATTFEFGSSHLGLSVVRFPQSSHNFILHRKAFRVENMTLLLYLLMFMIANECLTDQKGVTISSPKLQTDLEVEKVDMKPCPGQASECICIQNITEQDRHGQSKMLLCNNLSAIATCGQKFTAPIIQYIFEEIFKETQKAGLENLNKAEEKIIHTIINITEQSNSYVFENFTLDVVVMNSSKTNQPVPVPAPKVYDDMRPIQTLIPMEAFQNVPDSLRKVGVVTYKSSQQFNVKNISVMSLVIRIEIVGQDVVNLTTPLKIEFPVNNFTNPPTKTYKYSCQYYDDKENGSWKEDGCVTAQISRDVVECTCDHMTPFAVLLVEMDNIDATQWEILSYISYAGCSLSALFTASSVLSFIFNRSARAEVSSRIHMSLSAALFLLNISFMFSEWAAVLAVNGVCVFVAVTIHYSLLSSFTWMAIEALHLYLLMAKVFNIYIKHYMFKLSLIGWGVPAALIGSLLSIHFNRPIYGAKAVTISNSNATNAACWIKEPFILYGVNLSYFIIVFLFNTIILITVSRQILKLKKVDKHKFKTIKDASTVLGLMCLLGSSWGLVFLVSGYTSYPILYLFCISNTLQGFSIFLWMCRTARPEKKKATNTNSLSTVDTFTSEKQTQ